ncbi:DUF5691 domain-containing protein [Kribbella sp. NBC_01245]|uniref:DUF5691 domain-containing protein n=1 Tax=Kribbella sp. NBC_01245 TaxID=2903578 RepID=UPI002E28B255|nr:DUF5691 domain-containing protein [Kribbella sp. NBC_01245]
MSGWDKLVSAALLGTDRRPPNADDLPDAIRRALATTTATATTSATATATTSDPVRLLLDAAALETTYRRAGRPALKGLTPIAPAPGEDRPLVRPAAANRLAMMLGGQQATVLGEWLRVVLDRGWGVPPEFLPALADFARGRTEYRALVAAVADRRAKWLANLNPDWRFLALHTTSEQEDDWTHGTPNQRRAWLIRTREQDPAAAREALLDVWPSEPAVVRADFLALLANGLSKDDEEFAERALDDRASDVRRTAASLLARIPGSAYSARMAARAQACLTFQPKKVRVTLPRRLDESMQRDGIIAKPRQAMGEKAWWLRQILAAAPLTTYDVKIADAEVTGFDQALFFEALADATVRERDPEWARALLKTKVAGARLIAILPPEEWGTAIGKRGDLAQVVGGLPVPWPDGLAVAMLDLLDQATPDHGWARLASVVSQAVPAGVLDHPITRRPIDEEQTWRRRLIETLTFRREMYEELS